MRVLKETAMHKNFSLLALTAFTMVAGVASAQAVGLTLDQKENFLRSAEIKTTRGAKKGITGTVRATLADGLLTHDASIQKIDEEKQQFQTAMGTELQFRDTYKFNIAAYKLGRMIGLDSMIPPSIERSYAGTRGAWTWWVEDVQMDETQRLKQKAFGPDKDKWSRQYLIMKVFDQLIANNDRNAQNILYDKDWNLWLIDHSRAFRTRHTLTDVKGLSACDRQLLDKMKELTLEKLTSELKNWLRDTEIKAILARRDKIVAHFEKLGQAKIYEHLSRRTDALARTND
jgi:hypothetical protein